MDTKENRGTDLNAGPAKAYQLLRAFLDEGTLAAASATLEASGYRTHEFGDSVLLERIAGGNRIPAPARLAGKA